MCAGDLLDELGKGVLGVALAAAEGRGAVDLAAGHGISTRERAKLPGCPSLAQMPLHRCDSCIPTVASAEVVAVSASAEVAASSVAASSNSRSAASTGGAQNRPDLVGSGGAGRDRTCDRGIMSGIWAVHSSLCSPYSLFRGTVSLCNLLLSCEYYPVE